jgi:hypothetical protein
MAGAGGQRKVEKFTITSHQTLAARTDLEIREAVWSVQLYLAAGTTCHPPPTLHTP